jgi:hypothetical protein
MQLVGMLKKKKLYIESPEKKNHLEQQMNYSEMKNFALVLVMKAFS